MCLDPQGIFNKAKNTIVNKIGKTYLIIRGVLKTVIYGICRKHLRQKQVIAMRLKGLTKTEID